MKKTIWGFLLILAVSISYGSEPMKYSSSSIRNGQGRTTGRYTTRTSGGGIKYSEYSSGNDKTTIREVKPVYNSKPTGRTYNATSNKVYNGSPKITNKK